LKIMDLESPELERPISKPPFHSAPSADSAYDHRAEWSERYVTWFIEQTGGYGRVPPDVRASHRYEVEFNACVLDPEVYVQDTREELGRQRAVDRRAGWDR
jgi:hypothetical protein